MDRWGLRSLLEELLMPWTDSQGHSTVRAPRRVQTLAPKIYSVAGRLERIKAHWQKWGASFFITFEDQGFTRRACSQAVTLKQKAGSR